ncbi:FecR family protein [Telluribacter humicola]|uniref:FecR family protein n=1 Tax=Telluribacter humicola TaxID=1720261 RepID=UPI001A967CC1|nr:FecR domain-containing protein [Telluribacter humicola]
MQYSHYDVEEFCKDAYFISWATSPTPDSDLFWMSFLEAYPHKAEEIQLALEYIKVFRFSENEPDEQDLLRLKHRIWEDIEKPSRPFYQWRPIPYLAAASVILFLLVGFWFYQKQPSTLTYTTPYGLIQEIKLADGTVVTLNARSELKVIENIAENKVREVWLQGEAYFKVSKSKDVKFIVHTPETQVEVLGTEFNVNTRREKTQVVLAEGNVQLISATHRNIVMRPGQMAIVKDDNQVQLKTVQPQLYDSWKESILIMDDKPVSEIVEIMNDTYGLKLYFADSSLLNKKLSGKLLVKDQNHFLENFSIILNANLEKTQDGYLFR